MKDMYIDMAEELDSYLAKLIKRTKKEQNLILPIIEDEILVPL